MCDYFSTLSNSEIIIENKEQGSFVVNSTSPENYSVNTRIYPNIASYDDSVVNTDRLKFLRNKCEGYNYNTFMLYYLKKKVIIEYSPHFPRLIQAELRCERSSFPLEIIQRLNDLYDGFLTSQPECKISFLSMRNLIGMQFGQSVIINFVSLYEFLKTVDINSVDVKKIFFQIIFTLTVLEKLKINHNNLDLNRILVAVFDRPHTFYYSTDYADYTIESSYMCFFMNWTHAYAENLEINGNEIKKNESLGVNFCASLGACNTFDSRRDLYSIVCNCMNNGIYPEFLKPAYDMIKISDYETKHRLNVISEAEYKSEIANPNMVKLAEDGDISIYKRINLSVDSNKYLDYHNIHFEKDDNGKYIVSPCILTLNSNTLNFLLEKSEVLSDNLYRIDTNYIKDVVLNNPAELKSIKKILSGLKKIIYFIQGPIQDIYYIFLYHYKNPCNLIDTNTELPTPSSIISSQLFQEFAAPKVVSAYYYSLPKDTYPVEDTPNVCNMYSRFVKAELVNYNPNVPVLIIRAETPNQAVYGKIFVDLEKVEQRIIIMHDLQDSYDDIMGLKYEMNAYEYITQNVIQYCPNFITLVGKDTCDKKYFPNNIIRKLNRKYDNIFEYEPDTSICAFYTEDIAAQPGVVNTQVLKDFLARNDIFMNDVTNVLFQIVFALAVMEYFGMMHNDIHSSNILIVEHAENKDVYYEYGNKLFLITTKYWAYLLDWNTAYFRDLGPNKYIGDVERCVSFQQCNEYNDSSDLYTVMCYVMDQRKNIVPPKLAEYFSGKFYDMFEYSGLGAVNSSKLEYIINNCTKIGELGDNIYFETKNPENLRANGIDVLSYTKFRVNRNNGEAVGVLEYLPKNILDNLIANSRHIPNIGTYLIKGNTFVNIVYNNGGIEDTIGFAEMARHINSFPCLLRGPINNQDVYAVMIRKGFYCRLNITTNYFPSARKLLSLDVFDDKRVFTSNESIMAYVCPGVPMTSPAINPSESKRGITPIISVNTGGGAERKTSIRLEPVPQTRSQSTINFLQTYNVRNGSPELDDSNRWEETDDKENIVPQSMATELITGTGVIPLPPVPPPSYPPPPLRTGGDRKERRIGGEMKERRVPGRMSRRDTSVSRTGVGRTGVSRTGVSRTGVGRTAIDRMNLGRSGVRRSVIDRSIRRVSRRDTPPLASTLDSSPILDSSPTLDSSP